MDYDSMTLLDLKKVCKSRGLKISGKKDDVIIRLMENDEEGQQSVWQGQNVIQTPYVGSMPQQQINPQAYLNQNVQRVYINNVNSTVNGIGWIVIIYGAFRMLMAFAFSLIGIGQLGAVVAPIAFLLAFAFIFGGIMMVNEYLNGVYFTLITFLVSGLLSIIFAGGDLNPLSISLSDDGSMTLFSVMCTTFGMGLVALPLLMSFDDLKKGWPPSIERLINARGNKSADKIKIQCSSCDKSLQVPSDYSGKISCPHCQETMHI
ncbi:MAG: SAP domain-containing protein [Candidatus Poseidoniaceae archaeon]|uniref:SAP domain-containing protein n=1 Tax=uncultured Poseidoniia archaeon TaxID=1697135 RepID=A0A1B1TG52_9ARCH|nr:hypothetical protein [uncultured Candidatus Thalassoarchaea sp.]MAU74025.1 hypothetical protein [Euryarchaeota archaeon]MBL6891065.1 SAP domain-containing protein [Candidatus Poseidoniaceae archaeon]RAH06350.1 MAG: hypothetical protein CBC92_004010 [Euryarchaeota archaeon TMED132]|tara:strand:- start:33544 stop:34329 length:786 start_codon:yes stop_codon:yes gene_type:complete